MREFFEAPKMKKSTEASLTLRQAQLVELMAPIVQEYNSSLPASPDEIKKSIIVNIEQLQMIMGKILADTLIEQNKKTAEAIEQADKSPYTGY